MYGLLIVLLFHIMKQIGLRNELGAFVAGLMVSGAGYGDYTIHQLERGRKVFGSLFLASIGRLINPNFLWNHLDVLLFASLGVLIVKVR